MEETDLLAGATAKYAAPTQEEISVVRRGLVKIVGQLSKKLRGEVEKPLVVRGQRIGMMTVKKIEAGVKASANLDGTGRNIIFVVHKKGGGVAELEGFKKYKPLEQQLANPHLSSAIRRWIDIERQEDLK